MTAEAAFRRSTEWVAPEARRHDAAMATAPPVEVMEADAVAYIQSWRKQRRGMGSPLGRDVRDHLEVLYQTKLFKFRNLFKDIIAKERSDAGIATGE